MPLGNQPQLGESSSYRVDGCGFGNVFVDSFSFDGMEGDVTEVNLTNGNNRQVFASSGRVSKTYRATVNVAQTPENKDLIKKLVDSVDPTGNNVDRDTFVMISKDEKSGDVEEESIGEAWIYRRGEMTKGQQGATVIPFYVVGTERGD